MAQILTTQSAVRRLLESAEKGNPAHSYIFEGMKGIGKFTAAKLFAKAIHCTGEGKKPCGECPSCKKHDAGTHSDLLIFGEESQIKVDEIRSLTSELFVRPTLSDTKICIIKNGDSMNNDAQNALLKSFEEPPEYGIIIILSENILNLLPTILSRGVKLSFEPFSENEVYNHISESFPEKEAEISFIARYSGGIMGKAFDILENTEFFETREKMFSAALSLTGDRLSVFAVSDAFGINSGKSAFSNCDLYFELFLSFMRDVLAYKTKTGIVNSDKKELIGEFSTKVTLSSVVSIIERVAKVRSELNVSMRYDLWIVNLFINCWEDIHGKGSRS